METVQSELDGKLAPYQQKKAQIEQKNKSIMQKRNRMLEYIKTRDPKDKDFVAQQILENYDEDVARRFLAGEYDSFVDHDRIIKNGMPRELSTYAEDKAIASIESSYKERLDAIKSKLAEAESELDVVQQKRDDYISAQSKNIQAPEQPEPVVTPDQTAQMQAHTEQTQAAAAANHALASSAEAAKDAQLGLDAAVQKSDEDATKQSKKEPDTTPEPEPKTETPPVETAQMQTKTAQINEQTAAYESMFSVLSRVQGVELSIGNEQHATKQLTLMQNAADEGQESLSN